MPTAGANVSPDHVSVITSYSIHYTKLYETPLSRCPLRKSDLAIAQTHVWRREIERICHQIARCRHTSPAGPPPESNPVQAARRIATTGRHACPRWRDTTSRKRVPGRPRIRRCGAAHLASDGNRGRGSNRGLRIAGLAPRRVSPGVAPPSERWGRCLARNNFV